MSIVRKAPEERQKELLQIAMKLFIANGYKKTKVEYICEKADVAKGTFFYYFPSKESVLEAIVASWAKDFVYNYDIKSKGSHSLNKLRVFLQLFQEPSLMDDLIDKLMEENQYNLIQRIWKEVSQDFFKPLLTNLVQQGIEEGIMVVDNLEIRMDFFWGIVDTLFTVDEKASITDEEFSIRQKIAFEQIEQLLGIKHGAII